MSIFYVEISCHFLDDRLLKSRGGEYELLGFGVTSKSLSKESWKNLGEARSSLPVPVKVPGGCFPLKGHGPSVRGLLISL